MEVTHTRTTKLFDYYYYSQSPYLNANKLFLLQKLNQYSVQIQLNSIT